ncbi:hypothetical protein CFC21_012510 [Triticum aestivum]|nr:uncharacterized protein LOC123496888 [Aegilops tauschii subsp. strangulata]KAF6996134.1 hypothetical protein CFC21_012510 [Triticum aestivum]
MVVEVLSGDLGVAASRSPTAPGGVEAGCVLIHDSAPTPPSGCRGLGGSGRPPKKTAGRKPAAKASAVMESEQIRGDLGAALASVGAGAKAKRSKATPVPQRAPSARSKATPVPQHALSARSKAKLGDLSSLESAKLRTADKNLEVSDLDTVGETA